MPRGRPSSFTQSIADKLCEIIATGKTLTVACSEPGMPGRTTVFRWLESNAEFRDQYTRAREAQCEVLAAQIIDIADTCREGKKTKRTTCPHCDGSGKVSHIVGKMEGGYPTSTEEFKDCNRCVGRGFSEEVTAGDMIERSRLQVDARKWYLSKVMPKKYGEKIEQQITGADGGPLVVKFVDSPTIKVEHVNGHANGHTKEPQ